MVGGEFKRRAGIVLCSGMNEGLNIRFRYDRKWLGVECNEDWRGRRGDRGDSRSI